MPQGVVVVIPAYEPSSVLVDLVSALVESGACGVVVVDDGSGPSYGEVFSALTARRGVDVLTHRTNLGKGAALRTALAHLRSRPDIVGAVTADADGQHTVADIGRVAREVAAHDATEQRLLVLGERDFDLPDIPMRSRVGNKVTTALVGSILGRQLPDTQTGLRGLSTSLFPELLEVPGDRFDYEMRALIHLLSTGAVVETVPIETVYEGGQNASSHFRPLQDSAIIYAALFRQVGVFALASGVGFAVDILVFVLVIDLFFDGHPSLRAVGIATATARVISAVVNYALNRQVVFRPGGPRAPKTLRGRRSFYRYAVLAAGILTASWIFTTALSHLLGHRVVWAKLIVDSALFLVSYVLQRRWVFRDR